VSPGLQTQRTELTWSRTTLSSWAVAALTARVAFPAGIIAVIGPVAVTALAHARRRRLRTGDPPPVLSRRAVLLVAGAHMVIALVAALILW
jgi:hypothetical protein